MKLVFTIAIIVLLNPAARAQTGMPQSLSCTETAFNFSFSLGTKWKFSAPKMGPVDIRNRDYAVTALDLKIRTMKPDTTHYSFNNFHAGHFYKKPVDLLPKLSAKL